MGNTFRCTLFTAALLWFVPGCPDGKDPPLPSITVSFESRAYVIGSPALSCGTDVKAPEIERCDTLDPGRRQDWDEENSWTPLATARLAGFAMERHEVTNAQYRFCEESGKCTAPATAKVGEVDYYGNDAYDQHPVVNVSWEQAEAYCKFVERELPNEAQWEVAARLDGDGKMRTFPYKESKVVPTCAGGGAYLTHKKCASPTPLAILYSAEDATDLGLRDMASNVSEWVKDSWNPYAYCVDKEKGHHPACQAKKDDVGCAKSCDPSELVLCKASDYVHDLSNKDPIKVVRGGNYKLGACALRLFVRRKAQPGPSPEIGFRCVVPNGGPDAGPSTDIGLEAGADSGPADNGLDASSDGGGDATAAEAGGG